MSIVLDGTTGITAPAIDTVSKIAPADLGTGTPDATNFLRGDGTWQVISITPTTAQVLTATAGASLGAVGTYACCSTKTATTLTPGMTQPGSNLNWAAGANSGSGGTPSGTWRLMGGNGVSGANSNLSVWLRIS